ncbi:LOW QUALITY PROTEIN: hypothetical protein HID58_086470 [Brassica napus]|uniref:Uncharacterized protein n=1 Tax=Brassica napus TaxID=3708 RepID=A0ABQ7XRX3_BRANA|nr:LOW QUALITY PROTEIN: hypothetical protein HID58_086470 [Brassica napus]
MDLPQTGVPASVTQPSSFSVLVVVSIASGFHRLWDFLNFNKDKEFENHDVVRQICFVQGSDLTKETTRIVIRLLIDL